VSQRSRETLSLDTHGIPWCWMVRKNIHGAWVWYINVGKRRPYDDEGEGT
jgi:hypothetical protein